LVRLGNHSLNTTGLQIGFFENNDDVMAGLFKLQLGGARHWNIYTHSFLYFGVNGAWSRLNAALLWKDRTTINPCLPSNSSVVFESWIHVNKVGNFLPRSSPESTPYSATMINNQPNFEQCSALTFQLLRCVAWYLSCWLTSFRTSHGVINAPL
jgi:hypothetical protein